jgi:predicted transcriptional regulator
MTQSQIKKALKKHTAQEIAKVAKMRPSNIYNMRSGQTTDFVKISKALAAVEKLDKEKAKKLIRFKKLLSA